MDVKLRAFEPSDHPQAFALWERSPGVGLSGTDAFEPIRAFLMRNPGTSFVAEAGGELVGTMLSGHDGRRGFIYHLVVAESHRRRGIASALLNAGLDALQNQGIAKCHVFVFRTNADGLAFWRTVGAQRRTDLTLFSIPLDPK